ncbi:hypothetical protein N7539_009539 [Penicillium diatomitis]|uniref:Uncharacterized protein n=1 Tax=Penicillium diatomitis TaxID=2819901 RepID=A0A9W9WK93_9EURO|nr:uncharacterized protein N7539_009539 [Penicillium diatomitis]KAJ5466583.1 hypothetical protein N7539_009539 [Penicillium diatomitis]
MASARRSETTPCRLWKSTSTKLDAASWKLLSRPSGAHDWLPYLPQLWITAPAVPTKSTTFDLLEATKAEDFSVTNTPPSLPSTSQCRVSTLAAEYAWVADRYEGVRCSVATATIDLVAIYLLLLHYSERGSEDTGFNGPYAHSGAKIVEKKHHKGKHWTGLHAVL